MFSLKAHLQINWIVGEFISETEKEVTDHQYNPIRIGKLKISQ